jgi:uncharacterized protein (TIGR02246 family)
METTTQTTSDILEEIRSANQLFEQNFASRDAQGIASLYTSDGILLPPGADVQKGPNAIQSFWQMVMGLGRKTARLKTVDVEQEGETAIETGQYELGGADGERLDHGKYMVIWKREEGQWKLHKDIWNTSLSA